MAHWIDRSAFIRFVGQFVCYIGFLLHSQSHLIWLFDLGSGSNFFLSLFLFLSLLRGVSHTHSLLPSIRPSAFSFNWTEQQTSNHVCSAWFSYSHFTIRLVVEIAFGVIDKQIVKRAERAGPFLFSLWWNRMMGFQCVRVFCFVCVCTSASFPFYHFHY